MNRSFDEVFNSAINKSKSKQAHAFPKGPRFNDAKNPPCMRDSYDLSPLMMSSRIKRRNHTTSQSARNLKYESLSPGPAAYRPKSFLEQHRNSKNGTTFDQAKRHDLSPRGVMPGPGAYSPKPINEKQILYSMRPKCEHPLSKSSLGPGQYQTEKYNSVAGNNTALYSKYSKGLAFRIPQEERFHSPHKFITPGPNQYSKKMEWMNQTCVFGHQKRENGLFGIHTQGTPGPGQYHEFSEFTFRRRQLQSNLRKMEKLVKQK